MNVLIVGNGKGSFEMRAVQLGAAIGARVTTAPTEADWQWADRVVLVKKFGAPHAQTAHRYGLPIVWDALDFWSQPRDHAVSPERARQLLQAQRAVIKPALTICATQAMAEACGGVYLPHHTWNGLVPTPARETVSVVGYQGNALYLGTWKARLEAACARRGWSFVVNPADLSTVDLLVAFRDGPWDGWICREWKSGVKLANAIAAGRPMLTQVSAALLEIRPPHSVVETTEDLDAAFDAWTSAYARADAVARASAVAPTLRLAAVADRYRSVLESVRVSCAA